MGFGSTLENDLEFTPANVQLLVVDIQEKLFPKIGNHELLKKNTRVLIEAAKTLKFPVVVSEQYPAGLGPTILEIKASLPDNTPFVEKKHFSCMQHEGFQKNLGDRKIIIVTGIETHICVYQTVVDLLNKEYWVWIPIDAVGSRTKQNWSVGLNLMEREGAWLASTETILFKLLKIAGTEEFKALSKLIK